jgi:uncharacterized protein YndB with AHSA1/START domain
MGVSVATKADTALRLWRRFEASPERVFAAWTTPEALKRWWCPAGWHPADMSIDLHVGGRYQFSMQRESGAQVITVRGQFLEVEPAGRLIYTWQWEGAFLGMPETQVTIDFRAVAGGTEIALRQEPIDLRVCGQHLSGWLDAFHRIAEAVEPWLVSDTGEATAMRPPHCPADTGKGFAG